MALTVGSVTVSADTTYTASGLAGMFFQFKYVELMGSAANVPRGPGFDTTPAAQIAVLVGILRQYATDATNAAKAFWSAIVGALGFSPKKSATTPASSGLTLVLLSAAAAMRGTPAITIDGSAHTITRSVGSWVADGFTNGQTVQIVGSALNDSFAGTLSGVSTTVLSFPSGLTTETPPTLYPPSIRAGNTTFGTLSLNEIGSAT